MPCEKYELFYFPLNAMMYCSPLGQDWFRLNKSSSCRSPDSGYPPQYGGWMVFSENTIIFRIQYTKYNGIISPVYTVGPSGCPKKHGNSVTNWISSLLWISIVIPNFKSHSIIMSARGYFMKRVKDCKDVPIMSPQDEPWRRTSLLCL